MSEIINLNQQRKARALAGKKKQAAENRTKFGQTKAEKDAEKKRGKKLDKHLDDHKLETDEE